MYTLLTPSPLWTTKVCLCLLPPLFFFFEPAPAPWAVRSQALSLVSGSTSALCAGIQTPLSLTTCVSVLLGITRGCRQKPSVNNLTEKYICCKPDVQRDNKNRGREAALSKKKDSSFQGSAWGWSSWAETLSSTDQVCPCDTHRLCVLWLCCQYWLAFPHWEMSAMWTWFWTT